jgi:hypothetical protein
MKEKGRKYVYVQHEPFISFKKKKITMLVNANELLKILGEYEPLMVLCADTHNYQEGILKVNDKIIKQYIVGTGGADPDYVKAKNGDEVIVDDIKYKMNNYIAGYGYLEVSGDGVKFKKVDNWREYEGKGGKKRKTIKKRLIRKYKTRRTQRGFKFSIL